MGLAAEASYWLMHKRSMQNAADAAAVVAATAGEVNGSSAYQPEAKSVAARFGFTDGSGNVTVTATNPGTATNCRSCLRAACAGWASRISTPAHSLSRHRSDHPVLRGGLPSEHSASAVRFA